MTVSRSTVVAAPADRVFALVSDLPAMAELSPEAAGGTWKDGGGPRLGAVYAGRNRRGARRWSTVSPVTAYEPGRTFAFAVRSVGMPVATWTYDLEPVEGGTRVTETWTDQRGALIRTAGTLVTGVKDRETHNAAALLTDGQQVAVGVPGAAGGTGTGTAAEGGTASGLVDLNSATVADLDGLPGIGPVLAQRILDHREEQGPFGSVEELDDVSGIGPALYAEISPLVTV